MQLTVTPQGEVLVVRFEGSLDTGTAVRTEAEINQHLKDKAKMIFDLGGATFVSSAGLRIFLATAKRLMAAGGALRLCNANEVVMEVLQLSGFTSILQVKTTLQEALEGF